MTDAASEPTVLTTFPQEFDVPLTLRVYVASQEERDSWLKAGTNNVSIEAIADVLDTMTTCAGYKIISINTFTAAQLRQLLLEAL